MTRYHNFAREQRQPLGLSNLVCKPLLKMCLKFHGGQFEALERGGSRKKVKLLVFLLALLSNNRSHHTFLLSYIFTDHC